MTDIAPISRMQPTALGNTARNGRSLPLQDVPQRGSDQVDVSPAARYLSRLQEMPEVRTELVERVRAQIASGQYDSPDKISAALDNIVEDLA